MNTPVLDLIPEQLTAIDAHCHAVGWLPADEHINALEPAGEGNMNRTLRATTGQRSFILKQSVPFVAKYPQIPAPANRIAIERQFYSTVQRDSPLALRMPRMLGFDAAARLLMLEDVGAGGDMLSLYRQPLEAGTSRGVFTALIYWLWRLHSLVNVDVNTFANQDMRALNHAHIFSIPLTPGNGAAIDPGLSDIATRFQLDTALRNIAEELGAIYLGNRAHASRPCLLHGDYYPGSWLRHERLGVMVIDPEFAFVGPPEFDVGVMVAHLTFAGFAQADIMGLLRSYVTPAGFEYGLAIRFAAIEIIRRLLGVAQLPLTASTEQKVAWLTVARGMIGT